jgi:hypothetical protein
MCCLHLHSQFTMPVSATYVLPRSVTFKFQNCHRYANLVMHVFSRQCLRFVLQRAHLHKSLNLVIMGRW